jgi:hypothetical protein
MRQLVGLAAAFMVSFAVTPVTSDQKLAVPTEHLLTIHRLSQNFGATAGELLNYIRVYIPTTRWTEREVELVRSTIAAGSEVPGWLHNTLLSHARRVNVRASWINPAIVSHIMRIAPKRDIRWQDAYFTRYVVRQWVQYCIDPLVFFRHLSDVHCTPKGAASSDVWELSQSSRGMLILEMSLLVYNKATGIPSTLAADDVDILAL